MRGEVGRARADDARDCTKAYRDKAAVGQIADAHRKIDMLFGKIDQAIGKPEADIDIGIGGEEIHNHRDKVQPAKDHRRGDEQVAPWRAVLAGSDTFGFADILENAPAGSGIGQARIRQRRAPAAADQQPGAEMGLKVGDPAADRGQWQAEPAGTGRQGAGIDHREEDRHGFEAVHCSSRISEG